MQTTKNSHIKFIIFLFISLVLLFSTHLKAAENPKAAEKLPYILPPFPNSNALSYILIDADSKEVLAEKAADETRFPASLTKIMTAYVVYKEIAAGNISLKDEVLISDNAWKVGGSRSFIKVNTKIKLGDLLKAMIVQSGNDSAVAIAEYIAGDEGTFAQLMNLHAQNLGLSHTSFANATGLPNKNEYTTARDLATLTSAVINEFPLLYKWYSIKVLEVNGIKQYNRNKLLWKDKNVDGVKTGHTSEAGYNLIASAVKNDMRLIAVVLKADSTKNREIDAYKLLNYGFRFFQTIRVFEADTPIYRANVSGFEKQIPTGVAHDVYATFARNHQELVSYEYKIDPALVAPVKKGDKVGQVIINFNNKMIGQADLIALENINKASLTQSILNWFKQLFK